MSLCGVKCCSYTSTTETLRWHSMRRSTGRVTVRRQRRQPQLQGFLSGHSKRMCRSRQQTTVACTFFAAQPLLLGQLHGSLSAGRWSALSYLGVLTSGRAAQQARQQHVWWATRLLTCTCGPCQRMDHNLWRPWLQQHPAAL